MPYLYAQAVESAANGWPMSVRATALEFPNDPTCWFLDRQFMLGESLLVAPVIEDSGAVEYYLPKAQWTSWWDGSISNGPGCHNTKHGSDTLPFFVREGSILLVGHADADVKQSFDYDWVAAGGEVRVFGKGDCRKASVVDQKGNEIGVLRKRAGEDVEGMESLGDNWKVKHVQVGPS